MKILLTGSTGFLGSRVIDLLKQSPHTVFILARKENPIFSKLPKNFIVIKGTMVDKTTLLEVTTKTGKIDAIIHLAALVPKNPAEDIEKAMYDVNVQGTINLLDVFGKDLQAFIYASTVEVYGLLDTKKAIDEKVVPHPISYYAKTKLAGEKVALDFSKEKKIPVSILRFSVMYGPGDPISRALPNFIKAAIENKEIKVYGGEELRDYVHVNDAAKAVLLALEKKAQGIFLIASGKTTSIKDAAQIIAEKAKSKSIIKIEPRVKKSADITLDITNAKKNLGFTPAFFFPDEIDEAIEWTKKHKH